jgi:phosphoribosylamine--glycine ligase
MRPPKLPGKVFHAGTAWRKMAGPSRWRRVLCAVGLGTTVRAAQQQAYELAERDPLAGMQFRKDIGYRAIEREHRTRA